jgi:hypothetical protein
MAIASTPVSPSDWSYDKQTKRSEANNCNMSGIVTLELPDRLLQQVQEIATLTQRQVEEVLLEWIARAASELAIESLPDEQVLALCDLKMQPAQQEALSDLLARNQEGPLNHADMARLDELMQVYRHGMVQKARATKVAVERGLRSALSEQHAS